MHIGKSQAQIDFEEHQHLCARAKANFIQAVKDLPRGVSKHIGFEQSLRDDGLPRGFAGAKFLRQAQQGRLTLRGKK